MLAGLSSAQWGLFTSAQAAQRGVSRLDLSRLAEAGLVERVLHGVYRDAGAAGDEFEGVRAAWLAIVPGIDAHLRLQSPTSDVVVSGVSATRLHGVGDFREDRYELTSLVRRQSQRQGVRITVRSMGDDDVTLRHGLPTTTIERTLADLVAARHDLTLVAHALGDAMRQGSVDLEDLARRLGPLAARNGLPKGAGDAFVERLLQLAGLDTAATVRRLAGMESIAAPIAAEYFAELRSQAQCLEDQLAQLRVPEPAYEQIRRQAEALTLALRPQRPALETLQLSQAQQSDEWRKVITQLAPSMEAIRSAARFTHEFEAGARDAAESAEPGKGRS